MLALTSAPAPAAAGALLGPVEPDARAVPWSTLERLALEAGLFPPRYRPLSEAELVDLLDAALVRMTADGTTPPDDVELAALRWWRARYAGGGPAPRWDGCPCKEHPPRVRLAGRALAGWSELGEPPSGEAGLAWSGGGAAAIELGADAVAGRRWWAGGSLRAAGGLGAARRLAPDDPLAWPGWPVATGRAQVGAARRGDGAWDVDVPRAVGGVHLGNWALTAGLAPRRVGPGVGGGLTLDHGGPAFPALTGRRTAPFRWRGFMRVLAPDDLLLRVGRLSAREVIGTTPAGERRTRQHPWFMEWLVGWRVTPWFRFAATHAAVAASQDGSLWPDLLQINFPIVGTTVREQESGPVTDRIFALQFEARWRDAPWPLLPSAAGRVWWEYGGTDYLPSGPGGVFPEIAAPASIVGFSLVDPRWDLTCEFAELRHETVLWYANSGFPEGYSHDGWLLGHALGGGGQSLAGAVKVRPTAVPVEAAVRVRAAMWRTPEAPWGEADLWSVTGSLRRLPDRPGGPPLLWALHGELRREKARPEPATTVQRTWLRAWVELALP